MMGPIRILVAGTLALALFGLPSAVMTTAVMVAFEGLVKLGKTTSSMQS
jgi:hypothetical protein